MPFLCSFHTTGPFPSSPASLSPFGCRPSRDRLDDVRREAGEREEPADEGDGHALVLGEAGDRRRLNALDLAPPAVGADERIDQCLVAAGLRNRQGRTIRRPARSPISRQPLAGRPRRRVASSVISTLLSVLERGTVEWTS